LDVHKVTAAEILVVLPTLGDRLDFLAETLASVDAQRSDVDLRLVLVLPVSAIEARALGEAHGATLVEDPGLGISHAINLGIEAAEGETFYAWIGDDDLFRPGGLATLRGLANDPDVVVAYGGCDYISSNGKLLWISNVGRLALVLFRWGPNLIPHPGSLIRLDAMRQVGLFDESLRFAMDLDLFLKVRGLGRFRSTRQSVSAFRWHLGSLTVGDRVGSSAESEAVKRRYLPPALRPLAPVWERPVRLASARAARRISRRVEAVS
jgi:glycosyltransferase involved in cell wall biosynthesis